MGQAWPRVDYLPMFVNLRGRPCLVVGGGEVAARKAALLLRVGAQVTFVAPELGVGARRLVRDQGASERSARYEDADLQGVAVVIAATDDAALNAAVSAAARARGILVNVVDQPALCSFIMPSIVDRSPLIVAVSSGGGAPVLARQVRARLEVLLPSRLGDLAALCTRLRNDVKARLPETPQRRRFWDRALTGAAAHAALAGDLVSAERELRAALDNGAAPAGALQLIGVGAGDPELLSLRALRWLQGADLIVHTPSVPAAVLELARRDAIRELLAEGPEPAAAGCVARHAARVKAGEQVCVVAGGDAFRGESEAQWLTAAGAAGIVCVTLSGPPASEAARP